MHVVITGASRGIGRALLDHYRALGHDVTGTARHDADLAPLDVSDPDSVTSFAQSLSGQPVDLLICNAVLYEDKHHKLDGGYPAQMWADTFATNVTGVFLTIQALLPNLRAAPGARVAIISSQMGSQTRAPGRSFIYCASKAAALNLGRNLAVDLKPEGIAVGIYHPGWVRTDMGGESGDISAEDSASGLAERFAALGPDTTGCFQTWDGRDHAF